MSMTEKTYSVYSIGKGENGIFSKKLKDFECRKKAFDFAKAKAQGRRGVKYTFRKECQDCWSFSSSVGLFSISFG